MDNAGADLVVRCIYSGYNGKESLTVKERQKKLFSPEEIEVLRNNKYVKSISTGTIRFTEELKRYFYDEHSKGKTARTILLECGIDPEILGQSRINGIKHMFNVKARKTKGFTDFSNSNYRRPVKSDQETTESKIKQLEHELAYTRQEVEFLKKLRMADMEAQKQWESKHRPK